MVHRFSGRLMCTLYACDIIFDIVVIVVWGASFPAIMWLGALGGLYLALFAMCVFFAAPDNI